MKLILVLVGVISVAGLWLVSRSSVVQNKTEEPATISANPSPEPIPVSEPRDAAAGETAAFEIKLNAKGKNIAALATRLTYRFEGTNPFKVIDASTKKEGLQLQSSAQLQEAGWAFPVNKVYVDQEQNMLIVDFSAVNLTPEGYVAAGEETVGTVQLQVLRDVSGVVFVPDPEQTKVITKQGEELTLENKPGVLWVK